MGAGMSGATQQRSRELKQKDNGGAGGVREDGDLGTSTRTPLMMTAMTMGRQSWTKTEDVSAQDSEADPDEGGQIRPCESAREEA
ncbi:hypothetical protein FQN53_007709 [Emmonsiellopsis sp. PD_33]|nr:hypothetical protein FQN53_007709 [Emmonsiellopsis sp. PD_33]